MKTSHLVFLLCVFCVIVGCVRRQQEPTLDEAIDALPDEWWSRCKIGTAYSNNYAVLDKVIAVTNAQERIRLAWKLYNHFRHTPEWYVENMDGGNKRGQRQDFFGDCAWRLISGTNATPETIIEGWKMQAETIRDLEEIVRLTGPEWLERMEKRHAEKRKKELAALLKLRQEQRGCVSLYQEANSQEYEFALEVRWRCFRFFHTFRGNESYAQLPKEMKPAFLEQMKHDFFIYNDMTNSYFLKSFPPELKKAYNEVREQVGARKLQASDGKETGDK